MAPTLLVYRDPRNLLLGLISFTATAVFYLWSSQVLILSNHGVSYVPQMHFLAAALVIALLFGLLLPLQVRAVRLAAASAAQTGSTVLAVLTGTVSMTCCAPVILPSLLSLLGASGVTILGINNALARFWLPLATVSVILLLYALGAAVRSLSIVCPTLAGGGQRGTDIA